MEAREQTAGAGEQPEESAETADAPDAAVERITKVVSGQDDETLETHFALGSLFRRRGEFDRAIRVHQNIIARPNLSDMHLDRAHGYYHEVLDHRPDHGPTLNNLALVREERGLWVDAVADLEKRPQGQE